MRSLTKKVGTHFLGNQFFLAKMSRLAMANDDTTAAHRPTIPELNLINVNSTSCSTGCKEKIKMW